MSIITEPKLQEYLTKVPADFRSVVELMVTPAEFDSLVDRLSREHRLHDDEGLQLDAHAHGWLMQDAVGDRSDDATIRARSWAYAAATLAAVESEQERRRRYGLTNPAPNFGIGRDHIERLKESADIEHEIGLFVELRRSGRHLKGRCPFHPDKTPSLIVWPDIQAYRCFGCGSRGDVLTWLQNIMNWEFPKAVSYLEGVTGIEPNPRLSVGGPLNGR